MRFDLVEHHNCESCATAWLVIEHGRTQIRITGLKPVPAMADQSVRALLLEQAKDLFAEILADEDGPA